MMELVLRITFNMCFFLFLLDLLVTLIYTVYYIVYIDFDIMDFNIATYFDCNNIRTFLEHFLI